MRDSLAGARRRLGIELVTCDELDAFESKVSANSVDTVVLELGNGIPIVDAIGAATRAVPPSRIVAYCTLSPPSMRDAAEAVRRGVTRLAIHSHDDIETFLRPSDREVTLDDVQAALSRQTRGRATGRRLEVLLRCLEAACRGANVASLAVQLGVHRITLVRQFRRLGLPEPKVVITRYRLLLAAGLLEQTTRPIPEICSALSFGSYLVFRRTLVRHTGLRPASLRCDGQFDRLTRAMLDPMVPVEAPFEALGTGGLAIAASAYTAVS